MSKLKLCPFCGKVAAHRNDDGYTSWFQCERCRARGPACEPGEDAVAAWNRRAEPEGEPPMHEPVATFERNEHNAGMMVPLGGELWRLPPGRYKVYADPNTPTVPAAPQGIPGGTP